MLSRTIKGKLGASIVVLLIVASAFIGWGSNWKFGVGVFLLSWVINTMIATAINVILQIEIEKKEV